MRKYTLLVADDDEEAILLFREFFNTNKYKLLEARSGTAALAAIKSHQPDLVFMDNYMPGMDGIDVLREIRETPIDSTIVIFTGHGNMDTAIQAIKLGAYDYITKPLREEEVRSLTQRVLERIHLRNEVKQLRTQLRATVNPHEIVGHSPLMQRVFKSIGAVATSPNETNVLLSGETGTGKELVARAIHEHGPHANEPFIPIQCSAMPENLLESELFGYEPGAFTGANRQKKGKFELAGEGTIFLDEISHMTIALQQKLLRVLQEREFERLGGNRRLPISARFLAATNKNLEWAVENKKFLEDLYFRLNVMTIELPPLRHRKEDIPLLINHLLKQYADQTDAPVKVLSPEAMDLLQVYDYPGNVRELKNILDRCQVVERSEVIMPDSLPAYLQDHVLTASTDRGPLPSYQWEEAKAGFEQHYVRELLLTTKGNVTAAAEKAGVDRRTIQRLAKKHGIDTETFRNRDKP